MLRAVATVRGNLQIRKTKDEDSRRVSNCRTGSGSLMTDMVVHGPSASAVFKRKKSNTETR